MYAKVSCGCGPKVVAQQHPLSLGNFTARVLCIALISVGWYHWCHHFKPKNSWSLTGPRIPFVSSSFSWLFERLPTYEKVASYFQPGSICGSSPTSCKPSTKIRLKVPSQSSNIFKPRDVSKKANIWLKLTLFQFTSIYSISVAEIYSNLWRGQLRKGWSHHPNTPRHGHFHQDLACWEHQRRKLIATWTLRPSKCRGPLLLTVLVHPS